MSDEDEESWEGHQGGSFPSLSSSKDDKHIFSDEPFDGNYYTLDTVKEGSKESKEAVAGAESPEQEEFMAVSVASSDTPAVNNTAGDTVKKGGRKQPLGIQQNPSSGSSGFYPYNIYQSFSKEKKEGYLSFHKKVTSDPQ